jgi:hypothetical protein
MLAMLPLSHFPSAWVEAHVTCCRALAHGKAVEGLPHSTLFALTAYRSPLTRPSFLKVSCVHRVNS